MKKRAYGIDLGTTYSCIACIGDSGKPEVQLNSDGERTTPSVVWFDDSRVVVGEEAKGMAPVCPNDVASFIKREMGSDSFVFSCSRGDLRPEQISAYILKKLVQDANNRLGENIKDVVITCPAYFSFREREATKAAGEIAGLNVLEILNEPTAAAISYGLSADKATGTSHVMVYDLGGGTFDVTLIEISPRGINVVCTDGNHKLGGKDWDDRIIQLLIDKFQRATGIMHDLYSDPAAMQELMHMAERAKKALSAKTEVTEAFNYAGEKHRLTITREEFEEASSDLLAETVHFTQDVLSVARQKGVQTVDKLILVGGSTRMPQVARVLRDELNMEPQMYDPDEAVAKGAAIVAMAHILRSEIGDEFELETDDGGFTLETQEHLKEVADENGFSLETLTTILTPTSNVCSKSFGQLLLHIEDKVERCFNLIYRNTNLPVEASMTSYTLFDNQSAVNVTILENMEDATQEVLRHGIDPALCTELWKGTLEIKSGLPENSPIEAVFRLDESGLLHVLSRDPASGNEITAEIQTSSTIDKAELQRMRNSMNHDTVE